MWACTACPTTTEELGQFCPACGAALLEVAATPAAASALVGALLDGQFVLDEILGSGACGTVFRGRQLALERTVAVKVPSVEISADPIMSRRFAREARSAANIHHPGVVSIYAVGELGDGRPYMVMEFVDGVPLDHILADGPLAVERALAIARQIASALAETHAAGVVHRDLKPSNVMWHRDRHGDDRVTIVDFGIAASRPGTADATRLTAAGLLGTPHYMAPEQAHGEVVDGRADLYALGCLLFELLTGEPPFEGSAFEVLLAHMGRPAPLASERRPELAGAVDRLLATLLAKRPEDRLASADVLLDALDATLHQLGTGLASTLPIAGGPRPAGSLALTRVERPAGSAARPRRRWLPWLGAAIGSATLCAGAVLVTLAVTRTRASGLGVGLEAAPPAVSGGPVPILGAAPPPSALPIEPPDTATAPTVAVGNGRQSIVAADGDMTLRVVVPSPLVAGTAITAHLEIWDADAHPLAARQIVVTVEDAHGTASGTTATPHGEAGHFGFDHTFATPGRYLIRVFPPVGDTVFQFNLDVVP